MATTPVNLAATNVLSTSVRSTWERNPYSAAVLEDSPVAYWRLGEASGTTAVDFSGDGHDGAYETDVTLNQPGLIAGSSDRAADFLPTTAGRMDASVGGNLGTSYTLEAWIIRNAAPTAHRVFMAAWASNSERCGIFTDNTYTGELAYWDSNNKWKHSGFTLTPGVPYHVVVVVTGTEVKFYVNGAELTALALSQTPPSTFANVTIGARSPDGGESATATIDEATIYDFALSPDRIEAHYNAGTT